MDINPSPATMTDIEALHRISLELVRETSLEAVLDRTASVARRLTNARHAVVALLDEKGDLERFVYSFSDPIDKENFSIPALWWDLIGRLSGENGLIHSEDLQNDP